MDRPVVRSAINVVRDLALQAPMSIGPFNSLSIPGRSLETIIYLAVGLHGWWKTKETTNSLLSVVKMQNRDNEILSASSFESSIFKTVEADHPFHGATINDEESGARGLQVIELAGPSTRADDEPKAFLCVRALTSGLLCLFGRTDVFDILFNILQKCLIHFHQPDMRFDRHGPFSSALMDWIDAEKTNESFRYKSTYLMKKLDSAANKVSNISVKDLQNTQFFELGLVIAFLEWLLTEEYKHDPETKKDYPTRSFLVWSLAFILSELGFLVEASTTPILDQDMWRNEVSHTRDMDSLWKVHLVTSNSVYADYKYCQRQFRRMETRERRLVPIGTIPTMAFDYFRYYDTPDLNVDILNEIFLDTFNEVTERLPQYPYLQALAGLRREDNTKQLLQEKIVVHSHMTEYQQQKLEDWVAHPENLICLEGLS